MNDLPTLNFGNNCHRTLQADRQHQTDNCIKGLSS